MIRRHGATLRALLMFADGLLAAVLLVVLSALRFGDDWAVWWRQIIADPAAVLLAYAGGWVLALVLNGLYRPRARWSIRSEAGDLLRATLLMAVCVFALFLVQAARRQPTLPAHPLPRAVPGRRSSRGPSCAWAFARCASTA